MSVARGPRFLRLPWRSRGRLRADLDEELRFYFDMRTRELAEQGMGEREARREALREFGDLDYTKRYCLAEDEMSTREERRTEYLAELRQDAGHAWRTVRRAPGFAVVALLTLALGIGANTAIFSVVNGVLLRELPYADADRLVRVYGAFTDGSNDEGQIAAADFIDYRTRQRSFAALAAFAYGGGTYIGEGDPVPLSGVRVDPAVFPTLGVRAAVGRVFVPGDDSTGAPLTAILAHGTWQRLFGGDSGIIGRSIDISGRPRTVIGVLPASFVFPTFGEAELFTPLDLTPLLRDANRARKFRSLGMVGRLKPEVSLEAARAELTAIAAQLEREHPEANERITTNTVGMREAVVGDVRPALLVLLGASVLVLLIACANVAGVLLARAVARRQELAVRAALGAGRGRLVRQLLTESVLLAAIGGVIGVALAVFGTQALLSVAAEQLPDLGAIGIDARVLGVAALTALGCGVLFGLAPALAASRDVHQALRDAGRGASGGIGRHRLRTALVVGQLALAAVLLVGAGLLVRSLLHLHRLQLGYTTSGLYVFNVALPGARYGTVASHDQFFAQLHERLRAIPGVVSTATAGNLPLQGGASSSLAIEGRPAPAGSLPEVGYQPVSDDYFRVMQIPLARGRTFDARDHNDAPGAIIVSESLAREFWPAGDAIGARVRLGPDPSLPWSTVVGIAGDVRGGASAEPRPTAYVSSRQDHWGSAVVIVRAALGDPAALLPAIRQEMRAIDRMIPVYNPRTMDEIYRRVTAEHRLPMQLMTAFALLALALAAIGVYGVMAYSVASRTREIGVRVALGAQPRTVLGMVVRQGLVTAASGLVLGLLGAALLARLIASLLFGVAPLDPATFAVASAVLVIVSLAACVIPARRATRVDPLVALRSE